MNIKDYFAKKKIRRLKRLDNAKFNRRAAKIATNRPGSAKQGKKSIRALIGRGPLKTQICRLLGLLDKKLNGPLCRLGQYCPAFAKIGPHNGTLGYHITPAGRGDAVRLLAENVAWACRDANCGEHYHRSLYRDKHIAVFGLERIERIEAKAREIVKYSMAELLTLREDIKARLEAMK